jgi:anaerobic magnesium-protoporphyrin IX monomethyl ester cyclase
MPFSISPISASTFAFDQTGLRVTDVTLVNLNMLCVRYIDRTEREIHLPLGPLYLARSLEDAGYAVDFRDYQLAEHRELFSEEAIAGFLAHAADILFVSCMANLLPFALLSLRQFRRDHPETFIAIGGVGAAGVEREVMRLCPWIDAVGAGEGERSAPLLVGAVRSRRRGARQWDLGAVPGIVWRDGDVIRANSAVPRIENLDEIARPAYHLVDLDRYAGINVISSRGCPFDCTFCSVAPIWGRRPCLRSARDIVEEIAWLHEKCGARLFLFQDEYFVSSPRRVRQVCAAIQASGLPFQWKAFGRIDLTDPATMEAMARVGCIELRYGVESGCDRVLARVTKGFTAQQALEVLSEAVGIFPSVDAFYMWGFPFESLADLQESLLHMLAVRAMGVRILPSLLSLLPQTALYREIKDSVALEFFPGLFPEYMLTGHEICADGAVTIADEHKPIYDFIEANPGVFPGFFHVDVEHNVLPKYRLLQQFGFYPKPGRKELVGSEIECCGAHSPDVVPGVSG